MINISSELAKRGLRSDVKAATLLHNEMEGRVGAALAEFMTEAQMDRFNTLLDEPSEDPSVDLATLWLQAHLPTFALVATDCFTALLDEASTTKDWGDLVETATSWPVPHPAGIRGLRTVWWDRGMRRNLHEMASLETAVRAVAMSALGKTAQQRLLGQGPARSAASAASESESAASESGDATLAHTSQALADEIGDLLEAVETGALPADAILIWCQQQDLRFPHDVPPCAAQPEDEEPEAAYLRCLLQQVEEVLAAHHGRETTPLWGNPA